MHLTSTEAAAIELSRIRAAQLKNAPRALSRDGTRRRDGLNAGCVALGGLERPSVCESVVGQSPLQRHLCLRLRCLELFEERLPKRNGPAWADAAAGVVARTERAFQRTRAILVEAVVAPAPRLLVTKAEVLSVVHRMTLATNCCRHNGLAVLSFDVRRLGFFQKAHSTEVGTSEKVHEARIIPWCEVRNGLDYVEIILSALPANVTLYRLVDFLSFVGQIGAHRVGVSFLGSRFFVPYCALVVGRLCFVARHRFAARQRFENKHPWEENKPGMAHRQTTEEFEHLDGLLCSDNLPVVSFY